METRAANTLRTLGIVLTSILTLVACAVLLLFSLCMFAISGSHDREASNVAMVSLAIAGGVALAGGITITKLARGMTRETSSRNEPLNVGAPSSDRQVDAAPASPKQPVPLSQPMVRFDPAHFSPVSRAAVRQLMQAVGVYIAVNLLAIVVPATIPSSLLSFAPLGTKTGIVIYTLAYRLVAIVPYAVLLYSLSKHPGPRAFAYSLAVPAIPLLGSIFSIPLMLFTLSRLPGRFAVSLLASLILTIPAVLNFGIAYFGWTAIQKTGIHPPPKRLVIASAVIFLYNSMSGVVSGMLLMLFGGSLLQA